MSDSIDTPYLNMPLSQIDRVTRSKAIGQSHDQKEPFQEFEEEIAPPEKKEREQKEDTFEKSKGEENESDVSVKKRHASEDANRPGFLVDVTV